MSSPRVIHSPEIIEEAVRKYLEQGVPVSVLAKYYKAAKPTVYVWIKNEKAKILERLAQAGMTPARKERVKTQSLQLQVEALKKELQKTRDALVSLMLKHGEL